MPEFLVDILTTPPGDAPPAETAGRIAAEAERIRPLAARDHVLRLWRTADGHTLGLWRADDEAALYRNVLDTLPLRPWMRLEVTALHPHPNDPHPNDPGRTLG